MISEGNKFEVSRENCCFRVGFHDENWEKKKKMREKAKDWVEAIDDKIGSDSYMMAILFFACSTTR